VSQGGGYSATVEAQNITASTGVATPPAVFGAGAGQISGFTITSVPEPSTIALGGLGAAALLLFRRRK
jgi:hypothetical protein